LDERHKRGYDHCDAWRDDSWQLIAETLATCDALAYLIREPLCARSVAGHYNDSKCREVKQGVAHRQWA
jgi:hypothetical protein